MTGLESIILGAVQGLTEFIPVSSSGHLVLAQHVLQGASEHSFLEFINIGTLLALLVYFRQRIISIVRSVIVDKNTILLRNILLTSIPAGAVGYFLSDFIDHSSFFTSVFVVVVALATVGVIMILLDHLPHLSRARSGEALSWKRALGVGIAQMFALIPGVSRSGSTIIAGRIAGLSHADAAEYSFLASIPIMLAVTLKLFIKSSDRAYFVEHMPTLLLGNLVAFITGLLAIGFLLRYLSKHDLKVFGWYRVGLAAVVLAVLLIQ
jgi:undecaprenyl-diphosphatase